MSAYMDAIKRNDGNGSIEESPLVNYIEAWPNLCQAWCGVKDGEGKWQAGPATLMIFQDSGQMKWCLSPKYSSSVCFGCVENLDDVIGSVEQALSDGRCEWKRRGGKK